MQLADHVLEIILLFKEDQMGTKEGGEGWPRWPRPLYLLFQVYL